MPKNWEGCGQKLVAGQKSMKLNKSCGMLIAVGLLSLLISACQTIPSGAPPSALRAYTCRLIDRYEVTPTEKDVISPSTQWEIDTATIDRETLGC